jgi:hypothetical protein
MVNITARIPQGNITFVAKANSRSKSLRTIIPMSIDRQFGFKEGVSCYGR